MIAEIKNLLSVFVLIPVVVSVGLFLSWRLKFAQCTHVLTAWRSFISDRDPTGKRSSSFSALSAVLGGNLGTGNISGIAVALATGGPGALFWMWIMATLGAVLKLINCTLGVLYRQQDERGEFIGGPMYYLSKGLGMRLTAKIYCVLAICAALTVGNLVQMNSLSLPFTEAGLSPIITGLFMCVVVAAVILGGLHRFSAVASLVVPFMAIAYIGSCLVIVLLNLEKLGPAINLIFTAAFSPISVAGGVLGFGIMQGVKTGFDRGLFATDVGVGIDAIIHASVDSKTSLVKTAVTQGLISTLSPLIVMLVCTLTGLVLIMTDAWLLTGVQSTNLCIEAFRKGFSSHAAGHIITVTLFFFAFTTILTWSFCADKAVEYLFSTKMIKPFQILFVAFIPLGALFHVNLVWTVADIFMNLMLLINIFAVVGLYKQVMPLFTGYKAPSLGKKELA